MMHILIAITSDQEFAVANPYLPEDPSSFGPSDKEIEEFPYRNRGRKPEALEAWERYAAPWQKRAELRGFPNTFAMIAHDRAEAERDERTRQGEARLQAEIDREINGGAQARPQDATAAPTAGPAARIGYTRLPPQPSIVGPQPASQRSQAKQATPSNAQAPEDGQERPNESRLPRVHDHPVQGADAKADRNEVDLRNAVSNPGPQGGSSASETIEASPKIAAGVSADPGGSQKQDGRRHAPLYTERQKKGVNEWQDRINRGIYGSFSEAAADIDELFRDQPEVSASLKAAARPQFDSDGGRKRILPGTGGANNELRQMTSRIQRNELPDPYAQRRRLAYDDVERRRADRIEPSKRQGYVNWTRLDGTVLEMPEGYAMLIAESGARADKPLDALFAFKGGNVASATIRAQLVAALPRELQPGGKGSAPKTAPNAKSVAEIDAAIAEFEASGDADAAIARLFPVVMREALLPSIKDVAAAMLVRFNPVGAAIGTLADIDELARAYQADDREAMLVSTAGLLFSAAGLFANARFAMQGATIPRRPDITPAAGRQTQTGESSAPDVQQLPKDLKKSDAAIPSDSDSTAKALQAAIEIPEIPINGKLTLNHWPAKEHLVESSAQALLKLPPDQQKRAIQLSGIARGKLAEGDVTGALKTIFESQVHVVLSQVTIRLPNGGKSVMDDIVVRKDELRPEPAGPHSYRVSVGGKSGWIDFQEDLIAIIETKTGAGTLSSGQKLVRELARAAGRSDLFLENTVRAHQIDPRESYRLITAAWKREGIEISLDEETYVKFHNSLAKDLSYSLLIALIMPAFLNQGPEGPSPVNEKQS